jgi:hypothetical protein
MGDFHGGDKIASKLKEIADKLGASKKVRIGFLENATYPNGTPVAMIAAIQDGGAPKRGIPPRPFFRNMVKDESPSWSGKIKRGLKANHYDVEKTLAQLGEDVKGALRESIIKTNDPPLSPVTVMLRGMRSNDPSLVVTGKTVGEAAQRVADGKTNYGASTKPLVDQAIMLNAIDSEIVPSSGE